jgi:hypothetical protein
MNRLTMLLLSMILAGLASGCGGLRTTTTEKTALERAIMWQSLDPALAAIDPGAGRNRTFTLVTEEVDTEYEKVLISRARQEMLLNGYRVAADPETADIVVHVRADYAGIDDSNFLVGLPSIPIVTPAGGLETPELALFKRDSQRARNRLSLYGIDRNTGELLFDDTAQGTQTYFTRWRILFLIGFRTTNLEKPF